MSKVLVGVKRVVDYSIKVRVQADKLGKLFHSVIGVCNFVVSGRAEIFIIQSLEHVAVSFGCCIDVIG